MNNYRTVSNLPYLSKKIERVVAARLSAHMSEPTQFAYKPNHSVETALVCVQNYILRAVDNRNIVIILLLALSAAFNTVDHNVMLHVLSHDVRVVQTALDSYKSYLSDIVQSVHINGCTSPACPLTCGFLKVLYSVRSCSRFTEHHYQTSFGATTWCHIYMLTTCKFTSR